jgi:hypothetical protein
MGGELFMKICGQKLLSNSRQQKCVKLLAVSESDFHFGWVDVDIDIFRRNVER